MVLPGQKFELLVVCPPTACDDSRVGPSVELKVVKATGDQACTRPEAADVKYFTNLYGAELSANGGRVTCVRCDTVFISLFGLCQAWRVVCEETAEDVRLLAYPDLHLAASLHVPPAGRSQNVTGYHLTTTLGGDLGDAYTVCFDLDNTRGFIPVGVIPIVAHIPVSLCSRTPYHL